MDAQGKLPSAALGVAGADGCGSTTSCLWAEALLGVGYDVVLFSTVTNLARTAWFQGSKPRAERVVQWVGEMCTERAICEHLDAEGLTGFLAAAVAAQKDEEPEAVLSSVGGCGAEPASAQDRAALDVTKWIEAGTSLAKSRDIVGKATSKKVWFKNVDKGRRLAEFLLTRDELDTGPVAEAGIRRPEPDVVRGRFWAGCSTPGC